MSITTRRATLAFIFVTVVLDVLAFGVTIPVLPKLIERFVAGNTGQAARIYGYFGTLWALMQLISAPVLGALSDRFGRRPVLLISLFGLGLDYLFMALAPSLGWLLLGRIISGITAANWATASAYIADVTPVENRAAGYGLIGAAWGLGFVLGPAAGGLLGDIAPRLPFFVAGGLTLLNWLYGLFVLPESLPRERRRAFAIHEANPFGSLALLRSRPGLLPLGAVYFLHYLAHQVLPSVFVLYAGYRYHWGIKEVGFALTVVGVASTVVQGGLIKPIVARLGESRALLAGLAAEIVSYTIYGLAPPVGFIWVGVGIGAMAGLFAPSINALMSQRVEATEQGRLQGANAAMQALTGIIGPALFTQTFAIFIGHEGPGDVPGSPFLLAATVVLIAVTVAATVVRRPAAPAPAP